MPVGYPDYFAQVLYYTSTILSNTIHIVRHIIQSLRWDWTRFIAKLVRYCRCWLICTWPPHYKSQLHIHNLFSDKSRKDAFQICILGDAYYPITWLCKHMNGDGNHNKTRLRVHKSKWYRIQHHMRSFSMFGNAGPVGTGKTSLIGILTMIITHILTCFLPNFFGCMPLRIKVKSLLESTSRHRDLWPLLLTWFNFNPSMDK